MGRRDLSNYFAKETGEYVRGRVGNASFKGESFNYRSKEPNVLPIWEPYRLSFADAGRYIRVALDNNQGSSYEVAKRLGEKDLRVPGKYSKVVKGVKFVEGEECVLEVEVTPVNNSAGRTNDPKKLFNALLNVAVKPLLGATLEKISEQK